MSAITIRAAGPADTDSLITLFQASVQSLTGRDYSLAQRQAWAPDWIDRREWAVRHAGKQVWLALAGDQPAGFIALAPGGVLDMLYVHPSHARRGIASALLAELIQAARRAGTMRLESLVSLTARPFFDRSGFRALTLLPVERRGQILNHYRMERTLV